MQHGVLFRAVRKVKLARPIPKEQISKSARVIALKQALISSIGIFEVKDAHIDLPIYRQLPIGGQFN